jgi:hypothetical protein
MQEYCIYFTLLFALIRAFKKDLVSPWRMLNDIFDCDDAGIVTLPKKLNKCCYFTSWNIYRQLQSHVIFHVDPGTISPEIYISAWQL